MLLFRNKITSFRAEQINKRPKESVGNITQSNNGRTRLTEKTNRK